MAQPAVPQMIPATGVAGVGRVRLDGAGRAALPAMAGGCALLGLGMVLAWWMPHTARAFWHAYLLHFCFFLSLALGALFFVLLQHLTRAGWSVVVRRVAEAICGTIPLFGILLLPVLALLLMGGTSLYAWNDVQHMREDPLLVRKAAYLNAGFFALRSGVYFAVWGLLAWVFRRESLRQDASHDRRATLRLQRWSGPGMMAFAVTVTFASFDWLMSLDPHWFSAVYGVYFFSGCVVGFLAMLILALRWLQSRGLLAEAVTTEHYHDLGKLLLGFVFFWAYIAFSQYLLIWYANIPEETTWYQVRQAASWGGLSLLLLAGHFVVPFFALMPRRIKRSAGLLAMWAAFLLVMHLVDLYWLVMPQLSTSGLTLSWADPVCLLGFGLLFGGESLRLASQSDLVPVGDPRLVESLGFHNV